MKKGLLLFLLGIAGKLCGAQKVDSIYFHLYTDSLKKGFYNYISVDGKSADGKWVPLSSDDVEFIVKDSALRFDRSDLFIDSAYMAETVTIKAVLKKNPKVWKEVTISIRKRGFGRLPTNEEILEQYSKPVGNKKKDSARHN